MPGCYSDRIVSISVNGCMQMGRWAGGIVEDRSEWTVNLYDSPMVFTLSAICVHCALRLPHAVEADEAADKGAETGDSGAISKTGMPRGRHDNKKSGRYRGLLSCNDRFS